MTTTIIKTEFVNDLCSITLRKDNTFFGMDKTDQNNDPRMYTENKRSYRRGLMLLQERFNNKTTMFQVVRLLNTVGLKARSYCAVD